MEPPTCVRPGDDAPTHPMRSTGVLVPVEGLRAHRKRRAEESEQEEAMLSAEPPAASLAVSHAVPQMPMLQSVVAVSRSSAELVADVLARAGDDSDGAARLVEQQATLVSAAGLARVALTGLGDAASRYVGTEVAVTCTGAATSVGASSLDAVADARAAVVAARKYLSCRPCVGVCLSVCRCQPRIGQREVMSVCLGARKTGVPHPLRGPAGPCSFNVGRRRRGATPWLFVWLNQVKSRAAPSPFPASFESRRC